MLNSLALCNQNDLKKIKTICVLFMNHYSYSSRKKQLPENITAHSVITAYLDYGGCDYGECDYGGLYGECEYGGCEYGE